MRSRIMYIENKADGLDGRGRIGGVRYSKSGVTIYYGDKVLRRANGCKANHVDIESGDEYWISGPKKNGGDRLYGQPGIEIDEDVRVEYWTTIRKQPKNVARTTA
jgi:hypothetical protein